LKLHSFNGFRGLLVSIVLPGFVGAVLFSGCTSSLREAASRVKPRSGAYEVRDEQSRVLRRLTMLFKLDGGLRVYPEGFVFTNLTDLSTRDRWQQGEVVFRLFEPSSRDPGTTRFDLRIQSDVLLEGRQEVQRLGQLDTTTVGVRLKYLSPPRVERREPGHLDPIVLQYARESSAWAESVRRDPAVRTLKVEQARLASAMQAMQAYRIKEASELLKSIPPPGARYYAHRSFAVEVRKLSTLLLAPLTVEMLERG
jgi:hypothetical protein